MPLESGEAGEDGHQKLALRRRGIAPRIVQTFELGTLLGELVQDVQQVVLSNGFHVRLMRGLN